MLPFRVGAVHIRNNNLPLTIQENKHQIMGRGFGRGAKSVGIVTHAQMKGKAKKLPRGLRNSKKKTKRANRRQELDADDPNQMLATKVPQQRRGPAEGGKPTSSMQRLDAQIASIHFKESVQGKGRLKHLRKELVAQVRDLRRKHHKKQEKINTRRQQDLVMAHGMAMDDRNASRGPRQRRNAKYAAPEEESDDDEASVASE
jgi:hypothetical protein